MIKNMKIKIIALGILLIANVNTATYAESKANLDALFSQKNNQDTRFDRYPKYWIGQDKNKEITVTFEEFNAGKVRGSYQLNGKVKRFNARYYVTKLPYLYKLTIQDSTEAKVLLTFWIDLRDQKNLVIDQSEHGKSSQNQQFKLKPMVN